MAKGKKTGGRKAGTPNKATATIRQAIATMLDEYFTSEIFAQDIAELDPKDRVAAMERLASYAVPKLQAIDLDMSVDSKKTIEDTLTELSADEE